MAAVGGPGTKDAPVHVALCTDKMFLEEVGVAKETELVFELNRQPPDRSQSATSLQKIQFVFLVEVLKLVEKVAAEFKVIVSVQHRQWTTGESREFYAHDLGSFDSNRLLDKSRSAFTFEKRDELFSVLNEQMSQSISKETGLSCYFSKADQYSLEVCGIAAFLESTSTETLRVAGEEQKT